MNRTPYTLKGDAVTIDYANPIFSGHFPGKPMLPGVYIIQMATDWACQQTGKNLTIAEIRKCRYIKPVTPELGTAFQIDAELVPDPTEETVFSLVFTLDIQGEPVTQLKATLKSL